MAVLRGVNATSRGPVALDLDGVPRIRVRMGGLLQPAKAND